MTSPIMTTKLEQCARGINPRAWKLHDAACRNPDLHEGAEVKRARADSLYAARACINALMEPTPEMIAAAWAVVAEQKSAAGIARLGPGLGVAEIVTAYLRAALEGKS